VKVNSQSDISSLEKFNQKKYHGLRVNKSDQLRGISIPLRENS